MSILIRGMEMPGNCAECPVNMEVCKRGYEFLLAHPELYDQRAGDCPISFIPPHGRLIDADALIETCRTMARQCDDIGVSILAQFATMVELRPTIVREEAGES